MLVLTSKYFQQAFKKIATDEALSKDLSRLELLLFKWTNCDQWKWLQLNDFSFRFSK